MIFKRNSETFNFLFGKKLFFFKNKIKKMKIASVDLGCVNYAWCVLEILENNVLENEKIKIQGHDVEILEWKLQRLVETKKGKSIEKMVTIAAQHYMEIIGIWKSMGVNHVVLELQLNANPTTKVLSHVFQALIQTHMENIKFQFLNGKGTIPWIEKIMNECFEEDTEKPDVHDRKGKKKASVLCMKKILEMYNQDKHPTWLEAGSKRDDISDVFWQAIAVTFPLIANKKRKR